MAFQTQLGFGNYAKDIQTGNDNLSVVNQTGGFHYHLGTQIGNSNAMFINQSN